MTSAAFACRSSRRARTRPRPGGATTPPAEPSLLPVDECAPVAPRRLVQEALERLKDTRTISGRERVRQRPREPVGPEADPDLENEAEHCRRDAGADEP